MHRLRTLKISSVVRNILFPKFMKTLLFRNNTAILFAEIV